MSGRAEYLKRELDECIAYLNSARRELEIARTIVEKAERMHEGVKKQLDAEVENVER